MSEKVVTEAKSCIAHILFDIEMADGAVIHRAVEVRCASVDSFRVKDGHSLPVIHDMFHRRLQRKSAAS